MLKNTSALKGMVLDWAVAKAAGIPLGIDAIGQLCFPNFEVYCPSINWSQAGAIISKEKISTEENGQGYWNARIYRQYQMTGDTPLEAAMRCFVASKLGSEVDIPQDLL